MECGEAADLQQRLLWRVRAVGGKELPHLPFTPCGRSFLSELLSRAVECGGGDGRSVSPAAVRLSRTSATEFRGHRGTRLDF